MKIDESKLRSLDLSELAKKIKDREARMYFEMGPGEEHYKLLAYLSTLYDGITISDIGTYKGASALALSYNSNNWVLSYDISDMVSVWGIPDNVMFILTDGKPDIAQWLKSTIIMLDTTHDGIHERDVINFLIENEWKGILILDDIHHFPEQNKLWNDIKLPKKDLTPIGHWSGTGLIEFNLQKQLDEL